MKVNIKTLTCIFSQCHLCKFFGHEEKKCLMETFFQFLTQMVSQDRQI